MSRESNILRIAEKMAVRRYETYILHTLPEHLRTLTTKENYVSSHLERFKHSAEIALDECIDTLKKFNNQILLDYMEEGESIPDSCMQEHFSQLGLI